MILVWRRIVLVTTKKKRGNRVFHPNLPLVWCVVHAYTARSYCTGPDAAQLKPRHQSPELLGVLASRFKTWNHPVSVLGSGGWIGAQLVVSLMFPCPSSSLLAWFFPWGERKNQACFVLWSNHVSVSLCFLWYGTVPLLCSFLCSCRYAWPSLHRRFSILKGQKPKEQSVSCMRESSWKGLIFGVSNPNATELLVTGRSLPPLLSLFRVCVFFSALCSRHGFVFRFLFHPSSFFGCLWKGVKCLVLSGRCETFPPMGI